MKKFALSLILGLLAILAFSQTAVVLQNGSKFYVHNDFDSIKVHLTAGDTVYFPGGIINLKTQWVIDKELHIYGAGFYPDSTTATGASTIPSHIISFSNGSSNSSIEGLYLGGYIRIGNTTGQDSVSNLLIKRCNVSALYLGYAGNSGATNIVVSECVIRGNVYGRYAKFINIEKTIVNGTVNEFNSNLLLTNNVFLYWDCAGIYYPALHSSVTNSLIKNNIFTCYCMPPNAGYSTYTNNIFLCSPFTGTNSVNSTNIFLSNIDSVKFENYDFTVPGYQFTDDLRLQATSPGKNSGDDGNDIGIYGTSIPTKAGWVPVTPHVQYFFTSPNSVNGKLPVEIRVKAQSSY